MLFTKNYNDCSDRIKIVKLNTTVVFFTVLQNDYHILTVKSITFFKTTISFGIHTILFVIAGAKNYNV